MEADEELTFWCFVEFMNRMVSHSPTLTFYREPTCSCLFQKQNFLRDQSGMKKQLLSLQQLIGAMDPELYRHLGKDFWPYNFVFPADLRTVEKADGLNLFFCFRYVCYSWLSFVMC
jgi:hypothetical protein